MSLQQDFKFELGKRAVEKEADIEKLRAFTLDMLQSYRTLQALVEQQMRERLGIDELDTRRTKEEC